MTDRELLRQYLSNRSAGAFAELVRRHISLVYSVANRQVHDAHRAEDACQNVFSLLAQKAADIGDDTPVAAWLHQTAYFTALSALRDQARQLHHEREAAMNVAVNPPDDPSWPAIAAEIDDAVEQLESAQRDAVVLRFFAGKTYQEIGRELAISEDGARKRVDRALELLRDVLTRRGLALSVAVLAALLLANATQAAPVVLVAPVAKAALPAKAGVAAARTKLVLAAVAAVLFIVSVFAAHSFTTTAAPHVVAAPSVTATIVTTAPESPPYKGWIKITGEKQGSSENGTHLDTVTGTRVSIEESPKETTIYYQNPKSGELFDYHASTNLIRRGILAPDRAASAAADSAAIPFNYDRALQPLRQFLPQQAPIITHAMDGGLDLYDFSAAIDAAKKNLMIQDQENNPSVTDDQLQGIPTKIWVDPNTHLTARAIIDGTTCTYTYGGPDIASIYDAGAPRTAKIYDNRPTPETIAVLERIRKRATTRMPDGVSVTLNESGQEASISVHEQSKDHWTRREYTVRTSRPNGYTIDLPSDWANTDADEFFRRLATTASEVEEGGTESDVRFRDFTPHSAADIQPKQFPDGSSTQIITQAHYTGGSARSTTLISSPAYSLFSFRGLSGQYGVVNHVALVTDAEHPGLIGVHYELLNLSPDSVRAGFDFWLDPAEGDRPVQFTEESFEDPPVDPSQSAMMSSSGRYKTITDFSSYAKLPDGRQYAQVVKKTSYEPKGNGGSRMVSTSQTTFHFFANRTLPPLKIPDANAAGMP